MEGIPGKPLLKLKWKQHQGRVEFDCFIYHQGDFPADKGLS
jgi:hypothetical protein